MNALLIIAHAPLAHALRQGALHVFPELAASVTAVDVPADEPPERSLAAARAALAQLPADAGVLLLADMLGATPCNVAQRLAQGSARVRLLAGANLPMTLRALAYRHEPLAQMAERALAGGAQAIMAVPALDCP